MFFQMFAVSQSACRVCGLSGVKHKSLREKRMITMTLVVLEMTNP
jgi:hypothetical protein